MLFQVYPDACLTKLSMIAYDRPSDARWRVKNRHEHFFEVP